MEILTNDFYYEMHIKKMGTRILEEKINLVSSKKLTRSRQQDINFSSQLLQIPRHELAKIVAINQRSKLRRHLAIVSIQTPT